MKQTAIEFLIDNLHYYNSTKWNDIYEKAKEMEKEQIKDSFGVGCQVLSTRLIGYHEMAEQYYNETYKSKQDER
jgi:hypothetical protein